MVSSKMDRYTVWTATINEIADNTIVRWNGNESVNDSQIALHKSNLMFASPNKDKLKSRDGQDLDVTNLTKICTKQ